MRKRVPLDYFGFMQTNRWAACLLCQPGLKRLCHALQPTDIRRDKLMVARAQVDNADNLHSGQYITDHLAVDIGEAAVGSVVVVGELFMIQPEQM